MPDLKGQVKEGTQMAEVTEEATEDMPQTDGEPLGENEVESEEGEIEINLAGLKKMVEDMAYRIEEMEKKMMDMEKVKEEVVDKKPEEEKMAEEELPKLDGAPIEDNPLKFAAEQNRKNYGQKVENYQTSFLSKLYN